MSDEIELLPCPFCGGGAVKFVWQPEGVEDGMCACVEDECPGSSVHECTYEQWNKRAAPAVERQPVAVVFPDALCKVIHDTLRHYRMGTLSDGDGGGYPLIDAMSADGQTVSGGIEECQYLADAIWNACLDKVKEMNQ